MGDKEISAVHREKLIVFIENFQYDLKKILFLQRDCLLLYIDSMQNEFTKVDYFNQTKLMQIHNEIKKEIISQVIVLYKKKNVTDFFKKIFIVS